VGWRWGLIGTGVVSDSSIWRGVENERDNGIECSIGYLYNRKRKRYLWLGDIEEMTSLRKRD